MRLICVYGITIVLLPGFLLTGSGFLRPPPTEFRVLSPTAEAALDVLSLVLLAEPHLKKQVNTRVIIRSFDFVYFRYKHFGTQTKCTMWENSQ